jgi:hypothetical protein
VFILQQVQVQVQVLLQMFLEVVLATATVEGVMSFQRAGRW